MAKTVSTLITAFPLSGPTAKGLVYSFYSTCKKEIDRLDSMTIQVQYSTRPFQNKEIIQAKKRLKPP